jgi:hypothetical protein
VEERGAKDLNAEWSIRHFDLTLGNFTPDEFNNIQEALYKVRRRQASSSPSGERELNTGHLFAVQRSLVSGCRCDARAAVCIDKGVQSSKRLT